MHLCGCMMVCCPLSAESSSGEHETLRRHLQQRFLPQHIHGEKLSSLTLLPAQEERCCQTNKQTRMHLKIIYNI